MNRRTFSKWIIITLTSLSVTFVGLRSVFKLRKPWTENIEEIDRDHRKELVSVATVLFPSFLASDRVERIVGDFLDWLREQDPLAEADHHSTSTHAKARLTARSLSAMMPGRKRPIIDGTEYIRQISELKSLSRAKSLADLTRTELSESLGKTLNNLKVIDMPERPNGMNLFVDLITFFYRSSDALDLLYGSDIRSHACRNLEDVVRQPAPLEKT